MLNKKSDLKNVYILGAGCASFSLAARASEFSSHKFTIIDSGKNQPSDHVWGFWSMPWLKDTEKVIRKRWHNWKVISDQRSVLLSSKLHPYCAINRYDWLQQCKIRAQKSGVKFAQNYDLKKSVQILDSRPPPINEGMMLQHFCGFEVETVNPVFDDSTAILMDFRCDQSRGMHFIYCLPFSDSKALVESTLFSSKVASSKYYESAIDEYLNKFFDVKSYKILRRELGVIPLGILGKRDPKFIGIGGNGGAIRPSSGYAFSFIQKQIESVVLSSKKSSSLQVKVPHGRFTLWMDLIFLSVIEQNPQLSPKIFTKMAAALSGDEFALFLSGEAGILIWLKVVLAMPKRAFISGLFSTK